MDFAYLTKPCSACGGTGLVPDPAKVGAQQRDRRKQAGVTLRELGKELGLVPSYLSDLETGRPGRNWSQDLIDRYNAALQAIVSRRNQDE